METQELPPNKNDSDNKMINDNNETVSKKTREDEIKSFVNRIINENKIEKK